MNPLAVSVREAARLTSLSVFTIRRYIKGGSLRAVRVGRRVLVPVAECQRIASDGLRAKPTPSAGCSGE